MKIHSLKHLILIALLGLCGTSMAYAQGNAGPTYLGQGWSEVQRQQFYTTSQGSQMMRLDWFLALERPDSTEPFVSDGLARFGYLSNAKNPNGLPVGFAIDNNAGTWVGMTCAACHTNQIEYKGTTMQIDGAPTNADLYAFLAELSKAIRATLEDDAKFRRFADKVVVQDPGPKKRQDLHSQLARFLAYFSTLVAASTPASPWGWTRTDAFGMIFNRVSGIDLSDGAFWAWFQPLEENNQTPNAPVSYPFLWGTSRQDYVQWNGVAKNKTRDERLVRNITEVLGVFARINLKKSTLGYDSTVNVLNQLKLEEKLIHGLWAPQWPEAILGKIDAAKAAQGKILYNDQHCVRCHKLVDRKGTSSVNVTLVPLRDIGTDPQMAMSVACRTADTGVLAGSRQLIVLGDKLKKTDQVLYVAENAGAGVFLAQSPKILWWEATNAAAKLHRPAAKAALPSRKAAPNVFREAAATPGGCLEGLKVYRARPLDGIWATGPYLHNGSVPNLYQLLLPSDQRVKEFKEFYVGSREFDPVNVGFDATAGPFKFDTSVPGNSNKGHEYGTGLSEEQRWQLVEYLKTLPDK